MTNINGHLVDTIVIEQFDKLQTATCNFINFTRTFLPIDLYSGNVLNYLSTISSLLEISLIRIACRSRDNSVGIAKDYGLVRRDSIPSRGKRFSLLHSVQTGCGAHRPSYPLSTGGSFPRGRAARDMKLTTHLQLTPRSGMVEPYLHSLIDLHGVGLN
jgi:hypothetical protein